jgi:transposase
VALGRKNYLFAGSDAGRERAAAIYTLLGTTKLNGLDAELYLRHVYYSRRPQFRRKT